MQLPVQSFITKDQQIKHYNLCPAKADFVKPKNMLTFEPAVQILHCDHSF